MVYLSDAGLPECPWKEAVSVVVGLLSWSFLDLAGSSKENLWGQLEDISTGQFFSITQWCRSLWDRGDTFSPIFGPGNTPNISGIKSSQPYLLISWHFISPICIFTLMLTNKLQLLGDNLYHGCVPVSRWGTSVP